MQILMTLIELGIWLLFAILHSTIVIGLAVLMTLVQGVAALFRWWWRRRLERRWRR